MFILPTNSSKYPSDTRNPSAALSLTLFYTFRRWNSTSAAETSESDYSCSRDRSSVSP
jgi:hypothetical protein